MRYLDVNYQRKVLNRLADMAFRKGGTKQMFISLESATDHIHAKVSEFYK